MDKHLTESIQCCQSESKFLFINEYNNCKNYYITEYIDKIVFQMNANYYLYNKEQQKIIEYNEQDVMDSIYFLSARLPTENELKDHIMKNKDDITEFIKKNGIEESKKLLKRMISKIENKIPLYDVYSENIYIINQTNVYFRVMYNYYRFPNKDIVDMLITKRDTIEKKLKNNKYKKEDVILKERKKRKFELALDFLGNFDLDILFNTYMRVFYLYSQEIAGNTTVCQRPSFLAHFFHIRPYYTVNEIINLALNMNVACKDDIVINNKSINDLCNKVKENDISAKILLKHEEYMISHDKVGLVQYYSLHGSYFINQYLRNLTKYNYKNESLEKIITSMWQLIIESPEFDKNYTLYRFISNDSYLRDLDIGDIYTEPGFMSTTRDPFYRPDLYSFGFVLLKINIPGKTKGVGLCVETLSHFTLEQEIILPPQTMLKLVKRDENCKYFHTSKNFTSRIKTRYEFDYIGRGQKIFIERPIYTENNLVNFLKIDLKSYDTLEEKIVQFLKNYLDPMHQCKTTIGDKTFTIMTEFFDSTGAYKNFYAIETKKGFSLYSVYNDFMLFFLEIGVQDNYNIMHVDFNRKYSILDRKDIISDEDFVLFISSVAYCFSISKVIIYSEYVSCDKVDKNEINNNDDTLYYGGKYSIDIYNYITKGIKRYESSKILTTEINPKYSYYMLDKMKTTVPYKILKKTDTDELYQIYEKTYKNFFSTEKDNIADFYVWIIKTKCYLIELFIDKLKRMYVNNNPFENDYYVLDTNTFLYNRKYIETFPKYVIQKEFNLKRNVSVIRLNNYKNRIED